MVKRDRLHSSADRTTFFSTVGSHPFGVGLAFTVHGPGDTSSISLLFVGFFVLVFTTFLDGRALEFVFLAFFAARLHTVGSHPLFVFGAFLLFGPGVARRMSINSTEIGSLGADTCSDSQSVSTSASRATRHSAVGEHKVGVSGTFRRIAEGPLGTGRREVAALGAVGRTQSSVFFFQSLPFLFLFSSNVFFHGVDASNFDGTVGSFLEVFRC